MQEEGSEQQEAGWVYNSGGATGQSNGGTQNGTQQSLPTDVSWTASEYIAHPKNAGWFGMLGIACVVLAVIVFLITRDAVSTGVIVVLGVIVGVFAAHKPNVLAYKLDRQGITIGTRFYPYVSFKSFSIVHDEAFSHISLLSLKRFMPPMAVHYSPDDEEKILNTLSDYLPYEEHKRDLIDSFSKRVRF